MTKRSAVLHLVLLGWICMIAPTAAAGNAESALSSIDQLKSLSWTIYTAPESLERQSFIRYLAADTLRFAWTANDQNVQQIFSNEHRVMEMLLDQKPDNDELKCAMVTESGFAYVVVFSYSTESGWVDPNDDEHRRIYIAMKKLDQAKAASLADIRGVVKVYRAAERPLFGVPGVEYLLNPFADGH